MEQAKAAIRSAQLNIEFSHITAPITGRISSHRASIGNLIGGGQTAGTATLLTTIVSLDPIHLDFDMNESDFLAYQRFVQSQQGANGIDRTVEASLSDEKGWPRRGQLDFMDNQMALLRRGETTRGTRLRIGALEVDFVERKVWRDGEAIDLLPREFKLLAYFMRRPGQLVTREMLLEDVWNYKFKPQTNVVDVHIGNLRRKLDRGDGRRFIANLRFEGFRLDADS